MPDHTVADQANEDESRRSWREMKAKLVARLGLLDTTTPAFQAEMRRQAEILRDAPEEAETLDFIEAVMDTDGWDAIVDDE